MLISTHGRPGYGRSKSASFLVGHLKFIWFTSLGLLHDSTYDRLFNHNCTMQQKVALYHDNCLLLTTGSLVQLGTSAGIYFLFFWGYRGIVHPPSNDEGAERTWFEPEQRHRNRVPKRSVHSKQDVHSMPAGADKDTRQP